MSGDDQLAFRVCHSDGTPLTPLEYWRALTIGGGMAFAPDEVKADLMAHIASVTPLAPPPSKGIG